MRGYKKWLIWTACLALATPVLALDDPLADELEHNRRLLEKWRSDPAHYARLKQDLRDFGQLPPERQERIRKLDRDLHEVPPAVQAKLWRAMDRYVTWLDHLSDSDRRHVEDAPDAAERLRRIKDIKARQWLDRLPRALRDQVLAAPADQRDKLVAELRQKDHDARREWLVAARGAQPVRIADLPPDARSFINEMLQPLLTAEERKRLRDAEGQWPLFPRTLMELVDKHPIPLPGPTGKGPLRRQDLPEDLQQRLGIATLTGPMKKRLTAAQGKWPDYAIAVTELARSRNVTLPKQLGPSRPAEFAPAVRQFLKEQLEPLLTDEERQRLESQEGIWPEYPQTLLDLAIKKKLTVPGMALPGPREFWDNLRVALPEVPDALLRDFALTELSLRELADLRLPVNLPANSRERLAKELFKRKPDLEQKLLGEPVLLKQKAKGREKLDF